MAGAPSPCPGRGSKQASDGEPDEQVSRKVAVWRDNVLKRPSSAGALAPRGSQPENASAELTPRAVVLDIVLNFRSTLEALLPTDARCFTSLPADLEVHAEMVALLMKDPWLVGKFIHLFRAPDGPQAAGRRTRKKTADFELAITAEREQMRQVFQKL